MEIQSSGVNTKPKQTQTTTHASTKSNINFADELKEIKKTETVQEESGKEDVSEDKSTSADNKVENAIDDLANTVSELNQTDDKTDNKTKDTNKNADKNKEGADVINNNLNIDNKDKLPQMMPNMNFTGEGQPFSSFMNNTDNGNNELAANVKDLAEEAAILSTMAENIAIANKKTGLENLAEEISKAEPQKIYTANSYSTELIVPYDSIIMNETDVEVFNSLVNGAYLNFNNINTDSIQKSAHISKTLSDLLAKAMENNRPVRIEFDNGISVIIKISKDGKLSADFLPSTQVAEAYLKENLPLLKQKFSEQNIDYEELNQRERRNQDREQNRKKGQENE